MNGIKDIEAKIGKELSRFAGLESSIKQAVQDSINPLQASMGDIQQKQDDIQRAQDELSKNRKEFSHMTRTCPSSYDTYLSLVIQARTMVLSIRRVKMAEDRLNLSKQSFQDGLFLKSDMSDNTGDS